MKTKMRYLTTLFVATAATGAAIGFAPVAMAAAVTQDNTGPGLWNGGVVAGGTGSDPGPDTGAGPTVWRGGNPAGGTGIDPGPDTGSGAGFWSGGVSAGAIG
jgi:hypothetical protein